MRRALEVDDSPSAPIRLRDPIALALLVEMAVHERREEPVAEERHRRLATLKLSVPRHSRMEDRP